MVKNLGKMNKILKNTQWHFQKNPWNLVNRLTDFITTPHTRARGSGGERSQALKELLAKKSCVACATCCWDKGNYCQLHLDTSNGMLGRGMASHIACYGGTKKNKRPQFDEKHVANRPAVISIRQMAYPTNIYLMSNVFFFLWGNRWKILKNHW